MSSAICFNLDQSKILSSGIGLTNILKGLWLNDKYALSNNSNFYQTKKKSSWNPNHKHLQIANSIPLK